MAASPDPASHPSTGGGRHTLGPHVVGVRVVIRRVLRGQTGPTGGPALTDVLGVCERWSDGEVLVRREDGSTVLIRVADIVAGKPVPPRPSRFSRLSAEEVERHAAAILRPVETREHGGWLLRWSGGTANRANSILALGLPDVPVEEALGVAEEFYAARGRRPVAQVVLDSPAERELLGRGWTDDHPEEPGVEVLLAGTAMLQRRLREHRRPPPDHTIRHADTLTREWLVGNDRALANYAAVEATLRLDDVVFVSVHDPEGHQVARGRVNLTGDWALFADLTVQPGHRRRGLARLVTAEVTAWAAERGATEMLLQVRADNAPAQSLYRALGFERHHAYHYLVPPAES